MAISKSIWGNLNILDPNPSQLQIGTWLGQNMSVIKALRPRALAGRLGHFYLLKNLGMRKPSCREVLPKLVIPPFWRGVEMWGFMSFGGTDIGARSDQRL